jgi:hypothetical protein
MRASDASVHEKFGAGMVSFEASARTCSMQARLSGRLRWWEDLWTPSTFQRHRIMIGESKVLERR